MSDPDRAQHPSHREDHLAPPPPVGTPPAGPPVQRPPQPRPPQPPAQQDDGAGQQAKESARHVAEDAKEAGQALSSTAQTEAREVKDDVVREGQKLWDEATTTLGNQADDQMQRAAHATRSFTDDLRSMSRGEQPESGLATDLVGQLTDRTGTVADWLESHEPKDILTEVQRFARQRPVAFLAIAAGIGFAAGRITRSAAQSHMDNSGQGGNQGPSHGATQQRVAAGTPQVAQPDGNVPPPVDPALGPGAGTAQ
ncbi:MAG: hypothetical protein Q4G40_10870, partial [Brachybacterium sp.]|nr:hypothetical protein [Brachybacterium sp.]